MDTSLEQLLLGIVDPLNLYWLYRNFQVLNQLNSQQYDNLMNFIINYLREQLYSPKTKIRERVLDIAVVIFNQNPELEVIMEKIFFPSELDNVDSLINIFFALNEQELNENLEIAVREQNIIGQLVNEISQMSQIDCLWTVYNDLLRKFQISGFVKRTLEGEEMGERKIRKYKTRTG